MIPLRKDTERIQKHVDRILSERPASSVDVGRELALAGADKAAADRVLAAVDWAEQARIVAHREAEDPKATPDMISAGLAGRGFSRAERIEALSELDFVERGLAAAREAVESRRSGPAVVRSMLERDGYDQTIIDTVMNRLGVRWDEQMNNLAEELLSEGMSRSEIDGTMSDLGYSGQAVARFFRRNHVDWGSQAAMRAARMAVLGLPPERVETALLDMGFSETHARRAVKAVGFGTQRLADRMARWYMENVAASEEQLRAQLEYACFSREHIESACRSINVADVDWTEACVEPIGRWLDANIMLSRVQSAEILEEAGYSMPQIDHAFDVIAPQWKKRAQARAVSSWVGENIRAEHKMRAYLRDAGFKHSEIGYAIWEFYRGESEEDCAFRDACDMGSLYMSRNAIERELTRGGYTPDVVAAASRRLFFDWDMHAVRYLRRFAERILKDGLVADPKGMRDVMNTAGFTEEQTTHAMEALEFPWAAVAAQVILQNMNQGGAPYIERLLEERGFSEETKLEAKEMVGYDWINWDMRAQEMLSNLLAEPPLTPDEIRARMAERGHSERSIAYAFAHTLIPENTDWDMRTIGYIRKLQFENHYSRKGLISRLKEDGVAPDRIKSVMSKMRFDWVFEAMETALELAAEPVNMDIADIPNELRRRGFTSNQTESAFSKMCIVDGRLETFWDRRRQRSEDRFDRSAD